MPNLKPEDFIVEEDGSSGCDVHPGLRPADQRRHPDRHEHQHAVAGDHSGKGKSSGGIARRGRGLAVVLRLRSRRTNTWSCRSMKNSVKQSFTSDEKKVTDLLNKNNTVGGTTHLYSAVGEALKEIRKKAKNSRRALVVLTECMTPAAIKSKSSRRRFERWKYRSTPSACGGMPGACPARPPNLGRRVRRAGSEDDGCPKVRALDDGGYSGPAQRLHRHAHDFFRSRFWGLNCAGSTREFLLRDHDGHVAPKDHSGPHHVSRLSGPISPGGISDSEEVGSTRHR